MADETGRLSAPVDPVLRELGRLVFNFNAAEHGLRRIAFVLINPADSRVGEIAIDRMGASALEELVTALAAHALGTRPDVHRRLTAAVVRFTALRNARNDFVHAQWVIPNGSTGPDDILAVRPRFRAGTRKEVLTLDPAPIRAAAGEAADLVPLFQAVFDELERRPANPVSSV